MAQRRNIEKSPAARTREGIKKDMRPALARDNLKLAFAGNQNEAKSAKKRGPSSTKQPTALKSRKTQKSRSRDKVS